MVNRMSTKSQRGAALAKGSRPPLFAVRIDPDLAAYLRALAKREKRTIGSQLEVILEDFRRRNGKG